MAQQYNIQLSYQPLQPTVDQSTGGVEYREIPPDTRLQSMIYCYWELQTSQKLARPFPYRVVADGCMDIFFELENPSNNYIMGFCDRYTEFPLPQMFHYIGIRFLPAAFPRLFNIKATELSNSSEELTVVAPETSAYITKNLRPDLSLEVIAKVLDRHFLHRWAQSEKTYDPRFYEALHIILQNGGNISIGNDLNTGLSQRQLRRLFKYYIGTSPKTLSKVIRFQKSLQARTSNYTTPKSSLYLDAGYYDQAHFIKEFKQFYGNTPGQASIRQ